MNVALYLMTSKGLAVLKAVLESGVDVSHVVTAPALGMADDSDAVIGAACKHAGIPVFWHAAPPHCQADVSIAAGWRKLLDVPNLVVLHDSLLPRYRGFAPLVTALVNGEPEVGVTAFLARDEPDTGPIVGQRSLPVAYPARLADVTARLEPLYAQLAMEICETVKAGEPIRAAEQDHRRATTSLWRDEDDYRIDWTRDDRRIARLVDAVSDPLPGATSTLAGEPVRVLAAHPAGDVPIEDRQPGKIARLEDGLPVVVCGTGLVKVTDLRDWKDEPMRLTKLKQRFA
jgi:methionyl-tRNA formyltransferase